MSYDLVAVANNTISINFGSVTMGKILAVLRAWGALDETTPKPPESSIWTPENQDEWKAILAQRSPHHLQIPVWKFRDNYGWLVPPDECYQMYHLLRDVPDVMVQRVVYGFMCSALVGVPVIVPAPPVSLANHRLIDVT